VSLHQDLRALGWSCAELGRRFGVGGKTAGYWVNGKFTCPPGVVEYVASCRAAVASVAVPAYARRTGAVQRREVT